MAQRALTVTQVLLRLTVSVTQQASLAAWPHGGQGASRSNARRAALAETAHRSAAAAARRATA